MKGKTHNKLNFLVAVIISIVYFYKTHTLAPLILFWVGAIYFTYIETPDLDSPSSRVTRLWGPLKFIWGPFRRAGHREILHNIVWAPFILIGFLWMILFVVGIELPKEFIVGGICAIESHITGDKLS